jgi:serine/threonine-protein kinase
MSEAHERWQILEKLFHAALELPAAERSHFLTQACGTDLALHREVENLLAADNVAHSRIQEIVSDGAVRAANALALTPGTMLGPYRLSRELGQGGMGSVWLGQHTGDTALTEVAIKVLRPGLASPGILRRFQAEQRILGELNHPNIAQLLDAGTTSDDQPYFVMEYIAGEPIDSWCTDRALDIDARIDLFVEACSAVQFAHARQVVHRDIKPGNILVTREGRPKLLDFGIAKFLGPGSAHFLETAPGVRLMTPRYASPEQVRGTAVSTATDVYALGVVLYELLTERLPYRLNAEQPLAVVNAILSQEPAPPSTVVLNPQLRARLHGYLDGVLLTALRKEPQQRYDSVARFADQLRLARQAHA